MVPAAAIEKLSLCESPQFTSTVQGLSAPGSVNEPRPKLLLSPSSELWSAAAVTLGGTLWIVTECVYSVSPPSLSRILPFTVRLPLSVVGQLAELVPLKAPYPEPQSNA